MSYTVRVTIFCDFPECPSTFVMAQLNRGGLTKTWAAYEARVGGWEVQGTTGSTDPKRAFCPDHARKS